MGQQFESNSSFPALPAQPRLLDRVREAIRRRHYSRRTEETYVHWIKRFIYHSGKRHPAEIGAAEVTAFLNHLASERHVASATQNQALSALLFLYKEALGQALPWLDGLDRAKRPVRLPVVLSEAEVRALLAQLEGTKWLMASLLYGAGLRLRECLMLRVKDVDFSYQQIFVRDGKGGKDRVTMLPEAVIQPLHVHLGKVNLLHRRDPPPSHLSRYAAPYREARGSRGRHLQASQQPCASALVRDASAAGRLRHQDGAGITGAQGCQHHHDLHSCHEQGRAWGEKPSGFQRWDRSAAGRTGCRGGIPGLGRLSVNVAPGKRRGLDLCPSVERRSARPFERAELNRHRVSGFNATSPSWTC